MQQVSSAQKQIIQIAIVALLLIGCIAVLMPFTGTLLLAVIICVTTAPAHRWVLARSRGRSTLTAALMAVLLLLVLVAPMALLSGSLANGVELAIAYFRPLLESGLPSEAPDWVSRVPLAGSFISDYWHSLVASREEMNELLRQFIAPTRRLALATVSLFGQGLLQLVLVIFFVFFIFRDAPAYASALACAADAVIQVKPGTPVSALTVAGKDLLVPGSLVTVAMIKQADDKNVAAGVVVEKPVIVEKPQSPN